MFWTEPLQKDHVLRRLDNVVLTPHVGYVVDDNMKMFYENALKNIKALDGGGAVDADAVKYSRF